MGKLTSTLHNSLKKNTVPVAILFCAWIIVIVTNYKPNTWLLGWDSLLPEFDIWLNIGRSLMPAWQEYQGLGLLGGIGHGSEITRQLLIAPLTLLFPTSLIRYLWTFGMLLVGPLGVFFWTRSLIAQKLTLPLPYIQYSALLAGLAYLLNIATVQYFYVPLESFSSFYGFLPWLLFFITEYLIHKKQRYLLGCAIISVLGTSSFHVQTLFVVFAIVLLFFVLEALFTWGNKSIKPIILVGITLLCVNAFWLLPVGYFGFFSANTTIDSQQNLISTPESLLLNKGAGDLQYVLTLRGYWFEYIDYDKGAYQYLLTNWRTHLEKPLPLLALFFWSIWSIIGIILISIRHRREHRTFRWAFLLAFICTAGMLTAGQGFLGLIFSVITKLPLLEQMFRVTFTKWSIINGLLYSIGTGFLLAVILEKVTHSWRKITQNIVFLTCIITIFATTAPIFTGNLFYPAIQLSLPQSYIELINFFKHQPTQKRILGFPIHNIWGWHITDWGYRGSGFLWYGIKQPIVDRNFDVWSHYNESLYQQLWYAIYQEDPQLLQSILAKHDISYIYIDESITSGSGHNLDYINTVSKKMLTQIGAQQVFSSEFLSVYSLEGSLDSFTNTQPQMTRINSPHSDRLLVNIFPDSSILGDHDAPHSWYPFTALTKTSHDELAFSDDFITLSEEYTGTQQELSLSFPALDINEAVSLLSVMKYEGGILEINFLSPIQIKINDQTIWEHPTPDSQEIKIPQQPENILLDIGGKPIAIRNGEEKKIWIPDISRNNMVRVIDQEYVDIIDQQFFITTEDIFDFYFPSINQEAISTKTTLKSGDIVTLYMPSVAFIVPMADLFTQPIACDVFQRGGIASNIVNDTIILEAFSRGTLCTGWILPESNIYTPQLVRVKGENTTGRPLKLFFENSVKGIVLFEQLTTPSIFDQVYFLPSLSTNTQRSRKEYHSINVQVQSMAGEQASTYLSEILVYQMPFEFNTLAKLSFQSATDTKKLQQQTIRTEKYGTYLYSVNLIKNAETLLTLSQSYDPAWIAFPGWRIWDRYPHVTYNGWANAWIIPASNSSPDASQTTPAHPETITILFWPQLLTFAGYGVLVITLATLGWATWKEKSTQQRNKHASLSKHTILNQRTKDRLTGHPVHRS